MADLPPAGSGDDGSPDPRLRAALDTWTTAPSPAAHARVLAALADARVFLAVAARATGTKRSAATGLVQERGADMALLSIVGRDGSRALPAFSDGHAVQCWRPEARPVPVTGSLACAAVRDDDAAALLLDPIVAGFVVAGAELAALVEGRVPVPGSGLSTRRSVTALTSPSRTPSTALLAGLAAALRDEPVQAARLLDGPAGPVLGVVPDGRLDAAATAALAARVAARLGADLPGEGLDLAVVPAGGPGVAVPLRRRGLRRRRG